MKRTLYILLFIWVIIPHSAYSQQYFGRAEMTADLDTLCLHLRGIHPDMFRVVSGERFRQELDSIKASLPDSLTRLEFYLPAAYLTALVQDSHTIVFFPFDDFYRLDPWIFPANIRIDGKDLSVKVISSRYPQLQDAEILSINDKSSKSIADYLLSHVSSETQAFRTLEASNMFKFLFALFDPSPVYDVIYTVNGQTYREKLDAYKFNRKPGTTGGNAGTGNDPRKNFSFTKLDTETVLFKMRKFDWSDGYYRHFVDSMFRFVRKENVDNLIIDIRGNPGGDDEVADAIFKYICPVRFHFTSKSVFFGTALTEKYGLEWSDEGKPRRIEVKIRKTSPFSCSKRFKGDVYVLTDNGSGSMSVPFAHAVQYYKIGRIVGEETGGGISSFGDVKLFRLPATGLNYRVAFKEFYPAGGKREWRSVRPDIEVPAAQALDKVLEIIEERRATGVRKNLF